LPLNLSGVDYAIARAPPSLLRILLPVAIGRSRLRLADIVCTMLTDGMEIAGWGPSWP
jgi:hypothetical protein